MLKTAGILFLLLFGGYQVAVWIAERLERADARAQLGTPAIRPYLSSALAKRAARAAHERFDALEEPR